MTGKDRKVLPEEITGIVTERFKDTIAEDLVGVFLFGSRARGDATDGSDYDFLVVVKDGSAFPKGDVHGAAADLDLALQVVVSVIVKTESEWKREQALPLAREIRRHGKSLYGKAA